ncbi:MAG TPA: CBS domain-containing protein [Gaiellaceae bacterium]
MPTLASTALSAIAPLRVAEVMHWGLVSCSADASLEVVAALMSSEGVHCVVVRGAGEGSLWGVVSDLDLIAAASVRPLSLQSAGGTAMRPAVTVAPSESLDVATQLMARAGVAHLVVVDPVERRPIGVLSTLDLARALSST